MAVSRKFLGEAPSQNLIKYIVKKRCIFHLILVGILSILILSLKSRRVGGCRRFAEWTKSFKRDKSYLLTVPKSQKSSGL